MGIGNIGEIPFRYVGNANIPDSRVISINSVVLNEKIRNVALCYIGEILNVPCGYLNFPQTSLIKLYSVIALSGNV